MDVVSGKEPNLADIFIHIGPHKTGTSSIQNYFHSADLEKYDAKFLSNEKTYAAAKAVAQKRYGAAKDFLSAVKLEVERTNQRKILMSHEDFSGDLPGRGSSRTPYAQLARNLRVISRALAPHRVNFLFFLRPEADWLISCYKQNIKYRPKYHNFDDFSSDIDTLKWARVISEAKTTFKDRFIVFDYNTNPLSGIISILSAMNLPLNAAPASKVTYRNASISDKEVFMYERINQRAFIKSLIPIYKARASAYLLAGRPHIPAGPAAGEYEWPRRLNASAPFVGLEKLTERVRGRVGDQLGQPDLLPGEGFDVDASARRSMPEDPTLPSVKRWKMADQYKLLQYHLRGASELAFFNALAISYLRRNTSHTEKARNIFHKIWTEGGYYLAPELSTRWIISTLQTFMDHPANPAQAAVGAAGFFYGNLLKIYEGERSIEGLDADKPYSSKSPQTKGGFRGLDRYEVGGTDLLLNTNAAALEIAGTDPVAGLVLEELLLRTKHSNTVFQRFDSTRKNMKIDQPPFSDVWSFFEE